jgi:hypothetical protein
MNGLERISKSDSLRFTPNKKIDVSGTRSQGLEHHRDNILVGFSLRLRHRLSVHMIVVRMEA